MRRESSGSGAPGWTRKLRGLAAGLLLSTLSVAVCLALIESALRLAPERLLPTGSYSASRRHPELGFSVHATPLLYIRDGFVRRGVNREGFLDADHAPSAPPGVVRVGVFGDSFVDARQVAFEDTFYHRAQERLGNGTEWLAFGIPAWGTLHAYEAFKLFAPRYDIRVAVYVFVENDPGDNDYELKARTLEGNWTPGAVLSPDGASWEMRWPRPPGSLPLWYRAAKWVHRHSLLASVVTSRISLLDRRGAQVGPTTIDTEMRGVAHGIPDVHDIPTSWPPEIRARVERLTALILRTWKEDAARRGVDLLVLYVPRGSAQLRGDLPESDTWLPWLRSTCATIGLPLLDPSPELRAKLAGGTAVYGDHFTAAGHEVVSGVLADAIGPRLKTAYR